MKKALIFFCSFLLVVGVINYAGATPIGPVFPAPGGTTYPALGNIGLAGGLTYTYSGFDDSKYDSLYWGPWQGAPIAASLDGSSFESLEMMSLTSYSGNNAQWNGVSKLTLFNGSTWTTYSNVITRFSLTVMDTSNNPISLINAGPLGLSGVGVVVPVTSDFKANLIFEANFPLLGWMPLNKGFNQLNTLPNVSTRSTFSGGFYYEPPTTPVPEPTTILLSGLGLLGMGAYLRRRKKQKRNNYSL